jgi:hypothetical protein
MLNMDQRLLERFGDLDLDVRLADVLRERFLGGDLDLERPLVGLTIVILGLGLTIVIFGLGLTMVILGLVEGFTIVIFGLVSKVGLDAGLTIVILGLVSKLGFVIVILGLTIVILGLLDLSELSGLLEVSLILDSLIFVIGSDLISAADENFLESSNEGNCASRKSNGSSVDLLSVSLQELFQRSKNFLGMDSSLWM